MNCVTVTSSPITCDWIHFNYLITFIANLNFPSFLITPYNIKHFFNLTLPTIIDASNPTFYYADKNFFRPTCNIKSFLHHKIILQTSSCRSEPLCKYTAPKKKYFAISRACFNPTLCEKIPFEIIWD